MKKIRMPPERGHPPWAAITLAFIVIALLSLLITGIAKTIQAGRWDRELTFLAVFFVCFFGGGGLILRALLNHDRKANQ